MKTILTYLLKIEFSGYINWSTLISGKLISEYFDVLYKILYLIQIVSKGNGWFLINFYTYENLYWKLLVNIHTIIRKFVLYLYYFYLFSLMIKKQKKHGVN